MTVRLLSLSVGLFSAYAWFAHHARWTPDFDLYTQGGVGLFPSPLGRLLGMLGPDMFAAVSAAAAGAVVLFVGKVAGPRGAWAITLSAVPLYLSFASADTIALAFYAAFLAGIRPAWSLAAGSLVHLALIPYALLHVVCTRRLTLTQKGLVGFFVLPAVVLVLVVTPYAGLWSLVGPEFFGTFALALGAGALLLIPAALLFSLSPLAVAAVVIGAAESGLVNHLQTRYLLPAVVLTVVTGRPRRARPRGRAARSSLAPPPPVSPPALSSPAVTVDLPLSAPSKSNGTAWGRDAALSVSTVVPADALLSG